ncbi:MurR/RpiR family transcriptional regulator [Gymnodinialimonas ceratoperidinii]|uniref:MurR/RpiR family transcriptional regulator n=1 Tax=Gymnodinialimonas ceratoperidinii TaxID=2856823 RepID=A0A8F6TYD0_9RHOB|nr:MurR/RpiR family transcriptional regulator [Gymnodinialimonas ceratoperidinii]QXT40444.1 MurR/RpiR family transcriptional regulator [Gymnodinialimonas ceratoperidinii]
MSILTLMQAQLETFSAGERQIANTILDDPDMMARLSSIELARKSGRSQSSVVKFCQKLGFSGYQDLRLEITRAAAAARSAPLDAVHSTIDTGDDALITAQKLLSSKIKSLQETLGINAPGQMDAARDMLNGAARVQLSGVGASSLVARDFAYKLQKLGIPVLFDGDSHIQIAHAATLTESDVLVSLSQSGTSLETLRVAETARQRGATILTVTGLHPNRLAELADIALRTVTDEERVRSSAITSRDAQLILLDMVFLRLVQIRDGAVELISGAAEAVAPLKL